MLVICQTTRILNDHILETKNRKKIFHLIQNIAQLFGYKKSVIFEGDWSACRSLGMTLSR